MKLSFGEPMVSLDDHSKVLKALQGLAEAMISLTPAFRKTGACWCEHWKNVQNGHSEKCKQASAALDAAKPFLESNRELMGQ